MTPLRGLWPQGLWPMTTLRLVADDGADGPVAAGGEVASPLATVKRQTGHARTATEPKCMNDYKKTL